MTKIAALAGALAAATIATSGVASAHSPDEIVDILQDRGYSRIDLVDPTPPNYMANACRNGVRYHFHVSFYGNVTERREIGSCGYRAYRSQHDSRVHEVQPYQEHRRWGGWRRWNRWNSGY